MTLVTTEDSPARVPAARPSLLGRLDPRNSIGAAAGWLIAAVSLGLALAASAWVSAVASRTLLDLKHNQLNQYAERLSSQLEISLYGYLQSVRATAAILGAVPSHGSYTTLRQFLDELQRTLPQFAWAGYVDASGRVVAATAGEREGQIVAERSWFVEGLKAPWISAIDKSSGQYPLPAGASPARRYIALSAPIMNTAGVTLGVVGVEISWSWAENLKRKLDLASHPGGLVETFILGRDQTVVLGPASTVGKAWPTIGDHGGYVEGVYAGEGFGSSMSGGWTVWVREPKASALAGVSRLRTDIFSILFGLGLLAAAVGAWGAGHVLRRIGLLAEFADSVSAHNAEPVPRLYGKDEAARIGQTLTGLVAELQRDKAELQALNTELDARVAARTREVERLSEENQYAAVIRERLRIARELHDTLAHSMMAMLTQIRLLRKFADSNPAALKEELERAEEAARSGLNEARAAIAKMRHNPVRDAGLGAAVSTLVERLQQRTGIAVEYSQDARAAELADARAETLFRMIEELIHNTERHAHASHLRVTLSHLSATDMLSISVADDGIGFDPTAQMPEHYGVRGLREQAALIGARLTIESAPRQGVQASIRLPLSAQR